MSSAVPLSSEPEEHHPGWRTNLNAIIASQFLAIIAFSLRSPFLPFYLGDLGVEDTSDQVLWSGYINASGFLLMTITAPIWGAFADRHGRKPMLIRAQVCATCSILLMGLATEPWHLLGLRMAEGALTGTVPAATALVATTTPQKRLGFGLGLIQTAVFSGSALGPLLGGLSADTFGYRPTFFVASATMGCGALITIFRVQERFRRTPQALTGAPRQRPWALLLAPAMLSLAITMLILRMSSMAVQPVLPLFVEHLAHTAEDNATLSGIAIGAMGVTSAIASVLLGRLGDRFGYRSVLIVSTLGSGIMYFPMALAEHPWHLIVFQGVFGLFAGGMIPAANALVAHQTAPERRGMVFGLMAAATAIGGFIGPLLGSAIGATVGLRATFAVTGVVLLALFVWLIFEKRMAERVTTEE